MLHGMCRMGAPWGCSRGSTRDLTLCCKVRDARTDLRGGGNEAALSVKQDAAVPCASALTPSVAVRGAGLNYLRWPMPPSTAEGRQQRAAAHTRV